MTSLRDFRRLAGIARLLWPHARGEGRPLAAGVLLGAAIVLLHVIRPWPLKWVLDLVTGAHRAQPVVAWSAASPAVGILALSALLVVVWFAAAGAEYVQYLLLNGLGNRVLYRFRTALFANLLRQPLAFHESHEIGELLTRVIYDTSRLRRGLNGILIRIVPALVLFVAILAVLLWLNLELGLVFAAGGALALLGLRRGGRRLARAAKKQRRKEARLAAMVATELRSIRELQAFGVPASAVQQRFARRNDPSLGQEQRVRRLAAGLWFRVDVLLAVTMAAALWLGTRAALAGRLSAGDLVLFFSYAVSLHGPFSSFASQAARLGRTYACARRLAKIAERAPEIADRPGAVVAPALQGFIELREVSVKAPRRARSSRKWTLDGVTCAVTAEERVAIVGSNGAGKSTLLRMVLRLIDPDRGSVLLDGHDMREYSVESVRRQMSAVLEDSVLAGLTVRENIALGLPDASEEAVRAAAEAAQVAAFIARLPRGYDTRVRRGGELFSLGERQRIALARALLRRGRIWLLDEPTRGLDPATAADLVRLLLEVTESCTVLWVTHDPAIVPLLDRVAVLEKGQVAFLGTPDAYAQWLAGRVSRSSGVLTQGG